MLDLDYDTDYPTSDGQPMAETDVHRDQMVNLIKALEFHFRDEPQIYVSGNILVFYEPGNKRKHRSPDVLVALGVEKRERDNYKTWKEGKAPDLVFEITSRSTRSEDLGDKKGLYAFIGVREYVIFDPLEEYLEPRLRLYRLSGEEFLPVVGRPLKLETVNLDLEIVEQQLRLRDPLSGELLLTPEERVDAESQRAEAESQRAETESQRAEAESQRAETESQRAEAESQRAETESQRAEAESQRAETESQRAEAESQRAETESQRAEAESQRADAALERAEQAEAELRALRAKLEAQ